jgi:hypothetical protein
MVCNQKVMDTHTFLQTAVSSEVQQSGMDDDGSSEGDFILALPIAAFKVFGTA